MTDAADLARRFLTLWEDYLAALLADPAASDLLAAWLKAGLPAAGHPGPRDGAASRQAAAAGPSADAAPSSGASDQRDDAVAELARRFAQLEQRVAAIEQGGKAAPHPRRRNRRLRAR